MPHIAMTQVVTTCSKDGDGEVTGVPSTITNTYIASKSATGLPIANWIFDNMGSDMLLGPVSDEWDMSTGNHSKGICCIKDRLSYDDNPELVGIAPTELGICLRHIIWVRRHTMRQLD